MGQPLSEADARRARKAYASEIQRKLDEVLEETNRTTERILEFHKNCWPELNPKDWDELLQPQVFQAETFSEPEPGQRLSIQQAESQVPRLDDPLARQLVLVTFLMLLTVAFGGGWASFLPLIGEHGPRLALGSLGAALIVGFWALVTFEHRRGKRVSALAMIIGEANRVAWRKRESEFAAAEESKESRFLESERQRVEMVSRLLAGDTETMETALQEVLESGVYPLETNVSFSIHDSNRVSLDVDLPEVEDVPSEKATRLASGKISIKKKPDAEIRRDYATLVHGLCLWFASVVFQTLPTVQTASISGFTQRVSKKDGIVKDDYILSVRLKRPAFYAVNPATSDPIECVTNFDLRRKMSKTYVFSEIPPHNDESDLSIG